MSDFYRKKDPGQDRDLMIVDEWSFNGKNEKNKSVINFYSDRPSDTGAHNVSSGIITDLKNNIPQLSKDASDTGAYGLERPDTDNELRFSVAPEVDTPAFKNWFQDSKVVDEDGKLPAVWFFVFIHHFGISKPRKNCKVSV